MIAVYKDVEKILIVNLGGIGDVLLSTPALRALKKLYPKSYVVFFGVPRTCDFARRLRIFDEVTFFEAYNEKTRTFSFGRLVEVLRVLSTLRRERFDMVVNMRTIVSLSGAVKMALLFGAIGARYRVGRDTAGRGFFLNVKIKETAIGEKHEMDYDLETVALLGADISDDSFDTAVLSDADAEKKTDVVLSGLGVGPSDFLVGLHVGGMSSRRWSAQNYARAIERIYRRTPAKFVVTAGAGEAAAAEEVKNTCRVDVLNLAGRLGVMELAALIRRCRLFISNDTGPMHIAAVLEVPMVAIFGPGYLTRFDPRRISRNAAVIYKKVCCAPCDRVECPSMKCLKNISPDEVVSAAFGVLEKSREKRP